MNFKKINECERSRLERWSQFQLSHRWKRVGIIICLVAFGILTSLKFMDGEFLEHRFVLRRAILIGLLIITLSKEQLEDEMIVSLRAKSFTLAFVLAVLYALIQPLVNALVFYILDSKDISNGFSYFQVLSFMLLIQILFFEVLKRNR
ncbi:hypothetical protein [Winogradskyella tangerina]|uniref:hypothetical protein n=1 Tax=Winogradskyella tangerina TaxID=2023240 RepID=UPI000DBE8C12|nr:hypothetical protein [Winogradskyella tangerina]